jgi:hypothetical protein
MMPNKSIHTNRRYALSFEGCEKIQSSIRCGRLFSAAVGELFRYP